MTITPIETRYAGCRFRSRREARWAVFMDTLSIPWEYEPQGYLVDGAPYLPDFLIYPNTDNAFWFEVKGTFPSAIEIEKTRGLASGTGIPAYLYFGAIEVPAPDLSHIATMDAYVGDDGYIWTDDQGWRPYPTRPAAWEIDLVPTAYRFDHHGRPEKAVSGFAWWTECPHCDRFVIKAAGQIGWCPRFADLNDEEIGDMYPKFGHHTPRLLNAYRAARSARFEHGESP